MSKAEMDEMDEIIHAQAALIVELRNQLTALADAVAGSPYNAHRGRLRGHGRSERMSAEMSGQKQNDKGGRRNRHSQTWRVMAAADIENLDEQIRPIVEILINNGVETFESCQGGKEHCFFEPTVRFHGGRAEGFRALAVAMQHGIKVYSLRRYWEMDEGEPAGPYWEMTFNLNATPQAL